MKINELFLRPVDRDIDTVIKADSPINISTEVVEYVITKEIEKKIETLFEAYNDPGSANGVWISGFFGSGKSHLLKILSYVLSNKESDEYQSGELFAEKIEGNALLKANIQKAVAQPAESILFNIEQKADTTARESGDTLVSIFYKVFYEHLGFYGSTRHVARFEFDLYKKGNYETFVSTFNSISEESWTDARPNYWDPHIQESIAQALGRIYERDASDYEDYITRYEDNYNESAEDLVSQVLIHLDRTGQHKRLNFLIDEVGQFVGAHPGLLLSLQTLAETFATQADMRVWIFVTAQDNLDLALGREKVAETDEFSKIQGRFRIQLPLTSSNVDEVIQKRLLAKNPAGTDKIQYLWENHHNGLETLISFSEAGIQLKNDFSLEAFTRQYPFHTYQFDLFQQVIKKLAIHEAFQGKYASVGERSMLGVFQDVLKAIKNDDTGTLVSVDRLFDGLRISLRTGIQNVVTLAENNIDDAFTIRVLKVLFMVKYFDQFKATKRNISVMLFDSLEPDLEQHELKLTNALRKLEQEVYITRSGDTYEFLTDEEKDLEQEISAWTVDESQILKTLEQILFSQIIGESKLTCQGQAIPFTKIIDEKIMSRESELGIEFISPLHPKYDDEIFGTQYSMIRGNNLIIVLKDDENLWKDLRSYVKTNDYIRRAPRDTMSDQKRQFLQIKGRQNETRLREIGQQMEHRLAQSDFYIYGELQPLPAAGNAKRRIIAGFELLFAKVYNKYSLVSNYASSENQLVDAIHEPNSSLYSEDRDVLGSAEDNVLSYVHTRHGFGEKISLADLKKHFSAKPFGWNEWPVWHILLFLERKARIELRRNGEDVASSDFESTFRNSSFHSTTIVLPRTEIPSHQVRKAREFYQDLFDKPLSETEAKKVYRAFKEQLYDHEIPELKTLSHQKNEYGFLAPLTDYIHLLEQIPRHDIQQFYEQIEVLEDDILNLKEDKIRSIREFWNGNQRSIYDKIRRFTTSDATNLGYINRERFNELQRFCEDPAPYQNRKVVEANEIYDGLREELKEKLEVTRDKSLSKLEEIENRIRSEDLFQQLDDEQREELIKPLSNIKREVQNQSQIMLLKQLVEDAENESVNILNNAQKLLAGIAGKEPKSRFIRMSNIKFNPPIRKITNSSEVDQYVDELRRELMRYVENDTHITL